MKSLDNRALTNRTLLLEADGLSGALWESGDSPLQTSALPLGYGAERDGKIPVRQETW
jgi:hypothetical protein